MKSKILLVFIIIFIINVFFLNINVVHAEGISDVITGGDDFLQAGKDQEVKIDDSKLQEVSSTIYNILVVIGMCVAVVISVVLGIQFMIGSVEEKAKIKDALIPFVIGCIVIFGAFGIWKIFISIGNNL